MRISSSSVLPPLRGVLRWSKPRPPLLPPVARANHGRWASTAPLNSSSHTPSLLAQLRERGLAETITGTEGDLDRFFRSKKIVAYAGVDPTANSLHVGHLLYLMNLLHLYLNGHHSIALVSHGVREPPHLRPYLTYFEIGKATATVGDPSGRATERDSIEQQRLKKSFTSLWNQIEKFFENGEEYAVARGYDRGNFGTKELATNGEWLDNLGLVGFLSIVGRHVRISQMLARDSVKGRMDSGQGMNFAEFTYQLLQSYDFWHLYKEKNCRLQIGGNDQFGNITAGIELISRLSKAPDATVPTDDFEVAYGLTAPLLTTPSGEKFGKSAGNAVWLDETLTSPFELYQFFVRLPDEVVGKYLRMFTLLPLESIESAVESHAASPEKRTAQHLLAKEVVSLVHGISKASKAEIQTRLLFPASNDRKLSAAEVTNTFKGDKRLIDVPRQEVVGGLLTKIARQIGAVGSRAEAENMIKGGGLYIGHENLRITDVKAKVLEEWLTDGEMLIMRVGKGKFFAVRAV